MKTPNQVKFRGALYVKVAAVKKHKKCAKGTEWNDKQGRCLKLSTLDRQHMFRAYSHHAAANQHKTKVMHEHAHNENLKAAKHLAKRGFNDLAKKYQSRANHHAKKSQTAKGP